MINNNNYLTNLDTILPRRVGHGAPNAVPANVADAPVVGVGHPRDGGHGVVCARYVVLQIVLPQEIQHCNAWDMSVTSSKQSYNDIPG